MRLLMKGLGVSEGIAKGRAQIIENIEEVKDIQENRIIVVPFSIFILRINFLISAVD